MNTLKTFLKNILRPIKAPLKKFLLKILVSLDSDFLSIKYSKQNSETTADTVPTLEKKNPVLVVNENGVLDSAESVELAMKAMFETAQFNSYHEKLFQFALSNPHHRVNHDQLLSALKNELLSWIQSNDVETSYAGARFLTQLELHARKTLASKTAYITTDKQNPNAVYWPDPTEKDNGRSLYTEIAWAKKNKIINKNTPIGSAGSCFAFEIAHHLQQQNYNYVVTEPHPNQNGLFNSSARWGIIFNSPSFRQLIERAFNVSTLPNILWSQKRDGKTIYFDPFREDILFNSVEEYEEDQKKHLPLVREALLKCKVFVITLGVNEVWSLKSDGSVFSRAPWRIASNLVESKVLTVEENLAELQKMLDIWRRFNPEIKLIVSLSPVPLHATFRAHDQHVIAANSLSKATLRIVAEEFSARNKDVFYFPSYEAVTYCTPDPWIEDQRHVSRKAVKNVMDLFKEIFIEE